MTIEDSDMASALVEPADDSLGAGTGQNSSGVGTQTDCTAHASLGSCPGTTTARMILQVKVHVFIELEFVMFTCQLYT